MLIRLLRLTLLVTLLIVFERLGFVGLTAVLSHEAVQLLLIILLLLLGTTPFLALLILSCRLGLLMLGLGSWSYRL